MAEVVMPRLSDSMEEGTILQWLKQVGDEIAVGDELVEIETDKANMAYESDVAGTLDGDPGRGGGDACRSGLRLRGLGIRVRVRAPRLRGLTRIRGACGRGHGVRSRPPALHATRGEASETAAEGPTAQAGAPAESAPEQQGAPAASRPPPMARQLMGGRRLRRWPGGWRRRRVWT